MLNLTASDRDRIVRDAGNRQAQVMEAHMTRLVARLSTAREERKEEVPNFLAKLEKGVYEQHTLQRKFSLVAASAYVDFTSNKIYPWRKGNGAVSPAPANQVQIFDRLTLIMPHNITEATLAELLSELMVKVNFATEGRRPLTVPASQLIQSWIDNPDAGVDSNDDVVGGTRARHMRTGRTLQLDPEKPLVIMPQDTNPSVEFAWNDDYTPNAAPAGGETALDIIAVFEGEHLII